MDAIKTTSFTELLKSYSTPLEAADLVIRIKAAKKAAKITMSKLDHMYTCIDDIVEVLPEVVMDHDFAPWYNIYKRSSYFEPQNYSMKLAKEISYHL